MSIESNTTWEYHIIAVDEHWSIRDRIETLNNIANEGWRVISTPGEGGQFYTFERMKSSSSSRVHD